ncbi:MAG: DEAD/DEAH box helicase [Bacteroidales bacterium]|nr:DEAD/DEAH box helicase [Bacteroidales bacterium]
MKFKAGSLVTARNRDWVVLPSNDDKLVLLKPLGGSEEEITGIYLPLAFAEDKIESADFPFPSTSDLGDIASARVLYNATRLSFRNGAGPFRSLAKLSFRPRSYQMVPLIMSLKQENPIRLLIADDVGVGKTIEALIILKELLERREIKRFAVIVLPHLCEQWQAELKDKFGIDAVIIRSNTQARLDREIPGDTSVFQHYPYQVISIDYIKSDQRRQVFIQECPKLVIVDEAHTCSVAAGTKTVQQQRYQLIKDIAKKPGQHMMYLTATPHSGKEGQFSTLLGLIKSDYQLLDLPNATKIQRRDLAKNYVQRRRADVEKWMNEDTPFPKRDAGEFQYDLSKKYSDFYDDILDFALGLTRSGDLHKGRQRLRYWSALALLRGVMSSPAAGIDMIKNRIKKETASGDTDDDLEIESNPLMDDDYDSAKDYTPTGIINKTDWTSSENIKLNKLADQLSKLHGIKHDLKAARALEIVKKWLKQGFNPVVFCRFIRTANYLGEILNVTINNVNIQVVTSEDPDEVRKARIDDMESSAKKVLVATDCLSEGINLQDQFTAVLHYDLPWNPNRLEQREGRIDRYGQTAATVKAYLLYGINNPIDGVVLKVLLRKVREIRRSIGISIPFPEDSKSLMDTVLQAVISDSRAAARRRDAKQLTFDFGEVDEVKQKELVATRAIEKAADREHATRSIFAQHAIKAHEIEQDLKQSDEAIGNPEAVESFVAESLMNLLGVQITKDKKVKGYNLYTTNLPPVLKNALPAENRLKVSFFSPTPEGYIYLGRNHIFVEQLCQYLMANSLNSKTEDGPARTAVIRCRDVGIKTTLLLFRVRNVIEEKKGRNQFVAEEMLLWGYKGSPSDNDILNKDEVKQLMAYAAPSANITEQAKAGFLENELENISELRDDFDKIALQRAEILIEAHERFRKVMGGKKYKVVEPVLPMDLMGVYILLHDHTDR